MLWRRERLTLSRELKRWLRLTLRRWGRRPDRQSAWELNLWKLNPGGGHKSGHHRCLLSLERKLLLLEGQKLSLELVLPSLHGCIDGSLVSVSPRLLLSCPPLIGSHPL